MHICSIGRYTCDVTEDRLPPLKAALVEATGRHIRRIDRFIQLALLGAGRCCQGHVLPPGTALYLTSERGDIEVTVEIFKSIFREKQPPRPLSFVNSVSNAACFYLATGLQLEGSSQFVATHRFSFERALKLAMLDIACGRTDTALVGHVDVCVPPLKQHRIRLGVEPDSPVAEATHWILMRRDPGASPSLGRLLGVFSFADQDELRSWLEKYPLGTDTLTVVCGLGMDASDQTLLRDALPSSSPWEGDNGTAYVAYYDGLAAGVCTDFLSRGLSGELLHIARDTEGRYGAYHIRAAG